MRRRWLEFWSRAKASGDAEAPWRSLSARYAEPQRAYHTIAHIAHCLEEFGEVRDQAADPLAVEMALWYHDAVYDPRRHDNEEKSAELAAADAGRMGLTAAFGRRVADLIRVSTHQALAEDPDARLFADIDLAILGRPAEGFAEYERRVRVEYGGVPEADFRAGRSAIKYETQARINLTGSIRQLGA
jgi:predicted metal-dependent HD superfamily phosphohydrolase